MSPEELVHDSTYIVEVEAVGFRSQERLGGGVEVFYEPTASMFELAADLSTSESHYLKTQNPRIFAEFYGVVEFRVLRSIKGDLFPNAVVETFGFVGPDPEHQDFPRPLPNLRVPYAESRRADGLCVAIDYTLSKRYLLFLAADRRLNVLPLSPVNEMILPRRDPWVAWVEREVRRQRIRPFSLKKPSETASFVIVDSQGD